MYTQFLEDETYALLNPEHREFMQHIQRSSEQMERILDDFLDIALFEAGKITLTLQEVELIPWLSSIIEYSRMLGQRKSIEISWHSVCDPLVLVIDPSKMEQVLNNLISNAIKYTPDGSKLQVALMVAEAEAVISVRDNGPGIAEADIPRLFNPFERIRQTGTQTEKSSGLGLAIVKKIVEAHNGRVWVESRLGLGTTCFVSLPRPPRQQSEY